MNRCRTAVVTLLLAAVSALPAAGQDADTTTVSVAAVGPGTRQLDLLDLAGRPLANLALTPGVPQAFRVRVTDTDVADLTTGFTVSATMSNLYRSNGSGGYVWTDRIPSGDVSVAYAANPFSALGVGYDVLPKVQMTGTVPSCSDLTTLLAVDLATLTGTGLCSVVGTVGGGYALPAPVTVSSTVEAVVGGAVAAPYALTGNEAGNFPTPSHAVGVGAAAVGHDPDAVAGQAGSPRTVMVGAFAGMSGLLDDVDAALAGATAGLADVSETGGGAYTTVSAALTALAAQGQSALANAVAALPTTAQRVTLLSQLAFALVTPTVAELTAEVGTYNAFPMLRVGPTGPVATGTYEGTLTVTMVQP